VPPSPDRAGGALTLRRRLLLLAAAAILPLAVMSALALNALFDEQRAQAQRASLDLARALATAVDTELRLTVSALQSLAAIEVSNPGPEDLATLYRVAQEVQRTRPEWRTIILAAPDGQGLFSTGRPLGSPLPPPVEAESFREAVSTGLPTIGTLARGALGGEAFAVRVPVRDGGKLRYVLTAAVMPDAILQVVSRQRVPSDWIVSIFDAKAQRIARSRDHAAQLGTQPSPSLLELWKQHPDEGTGTSTTLEGERVYTAYSRLRSNGWVVSVGVPVGALDAPARHSAWVYGGGLVLSIALGSLVAGLLARGIAIPIARLGEAAHAIGRGEAPVRQPTTLPEVEAVSAALVDAAQQRERIAAERESLLDAERAAGAAAEQARRRLELLAAAGGQLSRSLDERTTLEAIGSVVVPAIGDWCRIDLLDDHGVLRRKLTHHRDPERRRIVEEFVRSGSVSADQPGSFPQVVATGEPYLANFSSWDDPAIADPTLREFARLTGLRATCVVPLVARDRILGAMGVVQAESGRGFGADDGVLIQELAQRVALALDNARLYAEAQAALHDAEVANRAKDEFLAMLGHELRNPLAPIASSLELMARRVPAEIAPQRRVIERQVAHLSRLVDDLLDVSRIVAGKIRLQLERVDLRTVLERALESAQPVLAGRAPEVVMPPQPVWVTGDPLRLAQVMGNLLSNAAKFSHSPDLIRIEISVHDGTVQLVVADEGIGMRPELLARVFERFVQGEQQPLQRAEGGLGLGLAIARSLVELHHGTIRAESDGPHRGSRFIVTLPAAERTPVHVAAPAPAARPSAPGARVLVVDDNADAADALAELLRLEGYEVRVAGSAEEALAAVEVFSPQLAVLDIGLPSMNGYDLAAALRSNPRTRGVRLIALTGYGRAPDRQRAQDAGFDDHFVKPAPLDELLARVAALVAGAEGAMA